jgi:hypothetical protein
MTMRSWLLLGTLLGCWGCSDQAQEVEDHRQEWLSTHPNEYVVEICSDGFARPFCELSAVSGGKEIAARFNVDNEPFQEGAVKSEEPMAALFDDVAKVVQSSDDCDVDFDPTYSYVSRYYCSSGEDGSGRYVKCFKPDTVDVAACLDK